MNWHCLNPWIQTSLKFLANLNLHFSLSYFKLVLVKHNQESRLMYVSLGTADLSLSTSPGTWLPDSLSESSLHFCAQGVDFLPFILPWKLQFLVLHAVWRLAGLFLWKEEPKAPFWQPAQGGTCAFSDSWWGQMGRAGSVLINMPIKWNSGSDLHSTQATQR